MKKTYTINAKLYHQQPLVIGQLARLLTELKGVRLVDLSPLGLISSFGEKLPRLLACVLLPDGKSPQEVELDALEKELFDVNLDQAMEVIADFLSMADLGSLLAKVAKMAPGRPKKETGSKPSASSSPEAVH